MDEWQTTKMRVAGAVRVGGRAFVFAVKTWTGTEAVTGVYDDNDEGLYHYFGVNQCVGMGRIVAIDECDPNMYENKCTVTWKPFRSDAPNARPK